ncbi:hypothetical protein [Curtobacterium flaccumfaciens]|uniref:hypothetical protein n=1 Tax=Curtobacterium flaccumfaciens TaxID=2035 RepID=UPI001BDDEC17|nr:hypothetical protein [Curtobacterium flaccumfaciens]MBT1681900.1 hypothetical protein [Curtobacterium flaccumfaciens pv. flaccumfaciens]
MSTAADTWWRQRPQSRRLGTSVANAIATLLPAFLTFFITLVIIGVAQPPDDTHIAHALQLLGNAIEEEALAFNTTIIGVLASLLIAQVLAQRPRFKTRHQIRNYISAALFAHLLAGLAVAATTLSVIGAIGNSAHVQRLWVIVASTLVAVGVAQWIEWYWARNRRLLRNRTRTELTVNAWSIHRAAAFLQPWSTAHRHPIIKLTIRLILSTVIVAAAATATMAFLILGGTHTFPAPAATAAYACAVAIPTVIGVLVAAFAAAAQTMQMLTRERRGSVFVWLFVPIWAGLPSVILVIFTPWERAEYAAWTVGVIVSIILPFLPLVLPVNSRWPSLHARLIAVSLHRGRKRRLTLLRDLWALERTAGKKARARRIRRVSLTCNRPTAGIGSPNWHTRHQRHERMDPATPARRRTVGRWSASYARGTNRPQSASSK